ncbi:site-specific integrase [Porphyromonas levii]|uniref:site-specific integrase n=1 Tax=Porphyromonas levii TaxID=28114 RepID=UPI001B8C51E2|nr:site-specific integrase [Porphyromonas levii]MBR8703325.1 Tyrosine recombinase XerC [Porphyromonas levii]MBR8730361.1 Tyrosine recombinase XerC [Porphyromonas levii]MBR8764121.1 Tyrosine recombinase XerC [Porphyromonas levii]MBR8766475.1 Tyrosine recombinase XerC [Porphyromonas levii]MBR8770413.1 Tyrosine recombinase XerC [Porphyromonas levii]
MEKSKLSVSFFLKRQRTDKQGNAPLIGRIRIERLSAQFSTKIHVPITLWDIRKQRLLGKSHIAQECNQAIQTISTELYKRYDELCLTEEVVTPQKLKERYQGIAESQDLLMVHFRNYVEQYRQRAGIDRSLKTYKAVQYAYQLMAEYLLSEHHVKDIALSLLDKEFIEHYSDYLLAIRPSRLALVTVNRCISIFMSVVSLSVKKGLLPFNPFDGFVNKRPKATPRPITEAELNQIIELPIEWYNYRLVRDLFVFSCFTGVAIGDIRALKEESITLNDDGTLWLKGHRQKTKTLFRVQLTSPALAIIERYKGKRTGYLFENVTSDIVQNAMKYLQKAIGMERSLTFHMARHTFASVITLAKGVPIETVSQMLGHTHLETTQIYARVSSDKIWEDIRAVEKKINNRYKLIY